LIQAAEQAWYACPHQTCLIRGCPNEQNISHQTREQKRCLKFLIECLIAFKFYQTRSNSTKQGGKTGGKMFGHQTFPVCPGLKVRNVHTKRTDVANELTNQQTDDRNK